MRSTGCTSWRCGPTSSTSPSAGLDREAFAAMLADPSVVSGYVEVSDRYGSYGICGFYALDRTTGDAHRLPLLVPGDEHGRRAVAVPATRSTRPRGGGRRGVDASTAPWTGSPWTTAPRARARSAGRPDPSAPGGSSSWAGATSAPPPTSWAATSPPSSPTPGRPAPSSTPGTPRRCGSRPSGSPPDSRPCSTGCPSSTRTPSGRPPWSIPTTTSWSSACSPTTPRASTATGRPDWWCPGASTPSTPPIRPTATAWSSATPASPSTRPGSPGSPTSSSRIGGITPERFRENIAWLAGAIPDDARLILVNGAEYPLDNPNEPDRHLHHKAMNAVLDEVVATLPNARVCDVRTFVTRPEDFTDHLRHYSRRSYLTMAEEIRNAGAASLEVRARVVGHQAVRPDLPVRRPPQATSPAIRPESPGFGPPDQLTSASVAGRVNSWCGR